MHDPFTRESRGVAPGHEQKGEARSGTRFITSISLRGKTEGALIKCLLCNKYLYISRCYSFHFTEKEAGSE